MAKQRKKFITQKVVSPYFVEWFCQFLQRWLFTWMRPSGGIYSKEEFEVSKAILMSFLESDALKQKFTNDGVAAIKEYVLGVLKYEHKFLSTEFMDVFALEVYSNSAHEGTNKGAKYNKTGGGLSPTSSLGTSTDQLADYDEQVSTERFKTCCDDFKKRKNWTPQWDELTSKSASILMDQESKTKLVNKSCWVADEMQFYVVCPNDIHRHSLLLDEKILNSKVKFGEQKGQSKKKQKMVPKKKGEPTKKELGKMKSYQLNEMMSNEEKGCDIERTMVVPEITSVFKVKIIQHSDGSWYLTCSCKFGKRFGGPCCHEFYVYKEYLQPIGVQEWSYRNVSIVHWAVYSYVHAKEELELTENEKDQLIRFKGIDASDRIGTRCTIAGKTDDTVDWRELLREQSAGMEQTCENDEDTISAMDWEKLPATARVTNYPREEVETCLLQLHNKNSEVINSSQFETGFSQGGDGWEEFVEFQSYDTDNVDLLPNL